MENYNLTAELKKIASGITSTDPNTELGNINSGVGNLDTAMQGVATAINGLSIPNPGSNIDGVANSIANKVIPDPNTQLANIVSAINNKNIPDPSSNITAVANAIVAMAGGKDLDDLITILTTMNGNIANLGTNHIIDLTPTTGGYIMSRGGGGVSLLTNEARYTSYTDTNNIGKTEVQGAIDKLSAFTYGNLTINSSYATGRAMYQRFGKVVTIFLSDILFSSQPPSGSWSIPLVSGLPKIATMANNTSILLLPFTTSAYANPIRLAFSGGGTDLFFHWSQVNVSSNIIYISTFSYICE